MTTPHSQTPADGADRQEGIDPPFATGGNNSPTGAASPEDVGAGDPYRSPPAQATGPAVPTSTPPSQGQSTSQTAKDQGKQVAQDAKESGKHVAQDAKEGGQQVAQTAADEARKVVATAQDQARDLLQQTGSELGDQAKSQQQRLAGGLRSLSEELDAMAQGSEGSGMATNLVSQGSDRTRSLADWLEHNEPGAVLDEVRSFARRRPGTFVALAAGVGLLAGRLTRGLTADSGSGADRTASTGTWPPPAAAGQPVTPSPVPTASVPEPGGLDPHSGPGSVTGYPHENLGADEATPYGSDPR